MTASAASAGPIAQLAARGAAAFSALAILSLASLHVLQPQLGVGDSMISQYALGPNGWVMNLCFASFAAGSLCLLVALAGQAKGILGRIGLVFLFLAAIGTASGGLFNMDPTTTDQSQMSFSGQMHGLAFMAGVPGELLASLLLSLVLRSKPGWNGAALLIVTAAVWLSLVVMAVNLIGWMQAGATGPAFFGVPNRTFMIAYALWMIVASWPLARGARQMAVA